MVNLLLVITVLAPIITALTAVFKKYVPSKFYALVPLVLGIILGPLSGVLIDTHLLMTQLLWGGLLSGLCAGGFYSVQNIRNK